MAEVRLSDPLRQYAKNRSKVKVGPCANVFEVIASLARDFPGIDRKILDDQDNVRRYVNVFVNGELIPDAPSRVSVADGDEIYIIQSVAGG